MGGKREEGFLYFSWGSPLGLSRVCVGTLFDIIRRCMVEAIYNCMLFSDWNLQQIDPSTVKGSCDQLVSGPTTTTLGCSGFFEVDSIRDMLMFSFSPFSLFLKGLPLYTIVPPPVDFVVGNKTNRNAKMQATQ